MLTGYLLYQFGNFLFSNQANCDVDATTFDGNTPLHIAAASGLKGQTALLVAAGADTTLQNSDDETPFDLANVAEVSVLNPFLFALLCCIGCLKEQYSV